MGLSETFSSHITNIKIRHILLFLTILQIRPIIPDFPTGHFFLDELVLNLTFFQNQQKRDINTSFEATRFCFTMFQQCLGSVSPWSLHASFKIKQKCIPCHNQTNFLRRDGDWFLTQSIAANLNDPSENHVYKDVKA